jgi:hypothetical protein
MIIPINIATIVGNEQHILDENYYQDLIGNCIVYSNKSGKLISAINTQVCLYQKDQLHAEIGDFMQKLEKQQSTNEEELKERIEFTTPNNKVARRIDLSPSEKFFAITFSGSIAIYEIEQVLNKV